MKIIVFLYALMLSSNTFAQSAEEDCKQKAKGTFGAEKTRLIESCIRHGATATMMAPMIGRISDCNRKADTLVGEARLKFVDKCIKNEL
jgi:hypothetical protein